MIRVLVVEGRAEVRWGLRMRLTAEPDMMVVGEAGNPEQAFLLARDLVPDVIVMDIGMQGANGVELVKRLLAAVPTAAALVLTLRGDEDIRARAQEAGARAFLEKQGQADGLLRTIRRLASEPVEIEGAVRAPCAMLKPGAG